MKYLKLYEANNLLNNLINDLENSKFWKETQDYQDDDIEKEYFYTLYDDLKISAIKFKNYDRINFYLIDDGCYKYIDSCSDSGLTYNKLYPNLPVLDRIVKIIEDSFLLINSKSTIFPDKKEFIYIYSEFIEEYKFELTEYKLGFIYLKFYEQFDKKNSNLDDLGSEYFGVNDVLFHNMKKEPISLGEFYAIINKEKAKEILEDFKSFEKRLKIMGFNKIKSSILFDRTGFYILLEEK